MMNSEHKWLGVRIPKTGGISLKCILVNTHDLDVLDDISNEDIANLYPQKTKKSKEALKNWTGGHWTIREYVDRCNIDLDDYFKFAFVRNPWDRAVSHYFYKKDDMFDGMPYSTKNMPFEEYVSNWDHRLQLDWITDHNGNVAMDFIGRFENFEHDTNEVLDRIGLGKHKIPHLNKSSRPRKPYWEHYTDKTKDIVAKVFKKDIKYFGYEFGK